MGTDVSFVGTAAGIEVRVIPREWVSAGPDSRRRTEGQGGDAVAGGVALLPLSAMDAWRVLSRRRPSVVVGVGGYSSGPVLALAALRRYPTMVLEQNALPGLTNQWLGAARRAAAVNFEASLRFFPRTGFVAGNPVRAAFFAGRNAVRT